MEDLGAPIAYLALQEGTPAFARDGERIGAVAHVLAAEDADIFDGLVIHAGVGFGGLRFVDAPLIEELYERGVVLDLAAEDVKGLPEPSENPATVRVDPADAEESELSSKLRRAWDLISGRY